MKEFFAASGGRYTYVDDILNLQELALSMTTIFSDCADFIISGCAVNENTVTSGYVWLNGKIRYFEGNSTATLPYYIYEQNNSDMVTYANESNKKGRNNYLCQGSSVLPEIPDAETGTVPHFIKIQREYAPRFIDQFMGKYAVLIDSPFSKQTIRKDLILSGNFCADKKLESKTALSVINPENGYTLKGIVKENKYGSWGVYYNGLLINEIQILTDGTFRFMKHEKELARIDETGFVVRHSSNISAKTGSIYLSDNSIINYDNETDEGAININSSGYQKGTTKFRNLNIYDGKQNSIPILQVTGKEKKVNINGNLSIKSTSRQIVLASSSCLKNNASLINAVSFQDSAEENIGEIGYTSTENFDFRIHNLIGNIILSSTGHIDVQAELKIKGINLKQIYVSIDDFKTALQKKVDSVSGMGLSSEDFTSTHKQKLEAISSGNINSGENGYVTAIDVAEALKKKLSISSDLSDLNNISIARANLNIYSKAEADSRYLRIENKLLELVSLSADEINGMPAEEAAKLKAEKQAQIRLNLDAEKLGTGDLKLAKSSNLSDLADKSQARKNISVYSTVEIDKMLEGKLNTDGAYIGIVFTETMKQKLENIKSGNFAYTDDTGVSHADVEGFVSTVQVKKELAKKADKLLTGYSNDEKTSIASNINVYNKGETDKKYAAVASLFQDYITYLVNLGKSSSDAQKMLRDKLDVLSKADVTNTYLRKDSQLSDLSLPDTAAKKSVCQKIGAAYADEYQTKLNDTGWMKMSNSGSGTDSSRLYIRQIGNAVCIQGIVNTARRDGTHWGGIVAIIPNIISPPAYGIRTTLCDWNDDAKYNRGVTFVIPGGSRNMHLYESGFYNVDTEVNFSYMV